MQFGWNVIALCAERRRHLAVIGVGKGTKKLNDFLDCAKVRVVYVRVLAHTRVNTLIGVSYYVFARVRNRYVR